MVAKLVSVESFTVRAGLGDVDSLDESVTTKAQAAVEAATVHLISIVRTEFDQTAQVNQYWVDVGELPFQGDFPKFFLSQGFVTTAVSAMVVRTATQLSEVAAATALDASFFRLDSAKGTLLITGTDRLPITTLAPVSGDRYFAQIEYTAGYTSVGDAFGTIYENVPDWLAEAAIILAQSIFATGKPCKDDEKNASGCPCTIESLVSRYIRFVPSALKPLF